MAVTQPIKQRTIVLTGGGTAGHVMPHLALLPQLNKDFDKIFYIGSHEGIEKKIIAERASGVKYYSISTVKLRRSVDLRNLTIPFKLFRGIGQAKNILKNLKPDVVFSKGGFVAYPVVKAAAKLKIPVIAHESDMTVGLANRLSAKYCKVICTTFAKTASELQRRNLKAQIIHTGSPIREQIFGGIAIKIERRHGFKKVGSESVSKRNLLVIGGSLGAAKINQTVRAALTELLNNYNIVHICGKGKKDESINKDGYVQLEFVGDIEHYFAWADVAVSRAGSNALCELLVLKKPTLFIPLSKAQSRGDQIDNANEVLLTGASDVLFEENLDAGIFLKKINELYENKDKYIKNAGKWGELNGTAKIARIIKQISYR